ncbi:MAG: hypothetical protein DRO13_05505 [Thermoprotei archaeon]|nr:MAG: hypothetical protein DRO13_05505 [Thermoprotei archaeon]
MKDLVTIKIVSIPQGFTVRDYINLALMLASYYHRDKGLSVKCSNGFIEFSGSIDDVCESFSTAYSRILDIANAKISAGIQCPKMHINDRNVLGKVLSKLGLAKPSRDARYIDIFKDIVKYYKDNLGDNKVCKDFTSELALSMYTKDRVIVLGSKTSKQAFAPLQPFKIEKYEYGKDFLDLSKSKMDVRATASWLSLMVSGWLLSYNGFLGGELVFSMPPSYIVDSSICSGEYVNTLLSALGVDDPWEAFSVDKGYYSTPMRVKASASPAEAFYMLLALSTPALKNPSLTPLRLVRISFDGKRFTMVEDVVVDLSRLKEFVESTSVTEELRRAIEHLSRCAIQSYTGFITTSCKNMFGDNAIRMIKTLYNAIMGSYEPFYAVYMLSRLSPEPVKALPYFKNPKIVSKLMETLTGETT